MLNAFYGMTSYIWESGAMLNGVRPSPVTIYNLSFHYLFVVTERWKDSQINSENIRIDVLNEEVCSISCNRRDVKITNITDKAICQTLVALCIFKSSPKMVISF